MFLSQCGGVCRDKFLQKLVLNFRGGAQWYPFPPEGGRHVSLVYAKISPKLNPMTPRQSLSFLANDVCFCHSFVVPLPHHANASPCSTCSNSVTLFGQEDNGLCHSIFSQDNWGDRAACEAFCVFACVAKTPLHRAGPLADNGRVCGEHYPGNMSVTYVVRDMLCFDRWD